MSSPREGPGSASMRCPKCGSNTAVIDSRPAKSHCRRRRRCARADCEHRFTTIEIAMLPGLGTRNRVIVAIGRLDMERLRRTLGRLKKQLTTALDAKRPA